MYVNEIKLICVKEIRSAHVNQIKFVIHVNEMKLVHVSEIKLDHIKEIRQLCIKW